MSPRTLSPISVEDRYFTANLSGQKDMLEIPRDSGKNRRRTKSPEREKRQSPPSDPDTKEAKHPRGSNVTHLVSTQCDDASPRLIGKNADGEPLLDRSLKTNHD